MATPITLENQIKITKNLDAICADLDVEDISTKLVAKKLFNQNELDEIFDERTRRKRTEKLVNCLLTKDNQHVACFQECLQEDYKWLADGLSDTVVTDDDRQSFNASLLETCSLPDRPRCFEGRSEDVEKISQDFLQGQRLAIIQGFGGQGKTALATVVGHEFVSRWGIRTVMADMRYGSSKDDIPRCLLLALKSEVGSRIRDANMERLAPQMMRGVESEEKQAKILTLQVCREISKYSKKILVILDNCEAALNEDTRDQFKSLLQELNKNCRNAYVLCTTRDMIHLPNMEVEYHDLKSLSEEASVSLFRWYYPDLNPDDGKNLALKCGFVALCLHLFGYLLQEGFKAADLINELAAGVGFEKRLFGLRTGTFDLNTCINLTYKRLQPKEKTAFSLLSLFPSVFTSDEAFALVSRELTGLTKIGNQKLILALLNRSLLTFDNSSEKYTMYSSIKDFAQHEISPDDKERFTMHYLHFMEPSIKEISFAAIPDQCKLFEKQRENLLKCIALFRVLDSKEKYYISFKLLASVLRTICRYSQALECYSILLLIQNETGRGKDTAELAFLHGNVGHVYLILGEVSAATENLTTAVNLYESMSVPYDYRDYHDCIGNLAVISYSKADYHSALHYVEECLKVSYSNNDENLRMRDQANIARMKAEQGDRDGAWNMLQPVLENIDTLDEVDSFNTLYSVGGALRQIDKSKEALLLFTAGKPLVPPSWIIKHERVRQI